MNFLEYSNETLSNIIPQEDLRTAVDHVFSVIAKKLGESYGPLGGATMMLGGKASTTATKDGYAIFKNIDFRNVYYRMIYNLIAEPCERLNNLVGDGTTTAIVLSEAIYSLFRQNQKSIKSLYRLPRELNKELDSILSDLIQYINSKAKPLSEYGEEGIYDLAYIVSNGNEELSKQFAEIYKAKSYPTIKKLDSPTNKTFYEQINGFPFPVNLIDEIYVKSDTLSADIKNIHVMVFDHRIDIEVYDQIIAPFYNVIRRQEENNKLMVIAPGYDKVLVASRLTPILNAEYQRDHEVKLILGQYLYSDVGDDGYITDLSVVTGSTVLTKEIRRDIWNIINVEENYDLIKDLIDGNSDQYESLIGFIEDAHVSCNNGSVFNVDTIENNEIYKEHIRNLNNRLSYEQRADEHGNKRSNAATVALQTRLGRLEMNTFILYVGANTPMQRNILMDSVDDTIKALRSANEHGVVPGSQLTVIQGIQELIVAEGISELRQKLLEIILDGLVVSYTKVLMGPNQNGLDFLLTEEHFPETAKQSEIIKYIVERSQEYANKVGKNDPDMPDCIIETDEQIQRRMEDFNTEYQEAVQKHSQLTASELRKGLLKVCQNTIDDSVKQNKVFDIANCEFSDKVITTSATDINVMIASIEIVKLLISGNSAVFIDPVPMDDVNIQ